MTSTPVQPNVKILRVIARLNIGGPAIHTVLLTRHLENLGYKTLLVAGQVGPHEGDMSYLAEAEGVKPVVLTKLGRRLLPVNDLMTFFRILQILVEFQPDIAHTHTAKAGALGRVAALFYNLAHSSKRLTQSLIRKLMPNKAAQNLTTNADRGRCRVVHTFHGHVLQGYFSPFMSRLYQLIETILARFTDIIVVVSEQQKVELYNKFGIGREEQYRIVPLGFDFLPFAECSKNRGRFKAHLGLPENEFKLVGTVGRLTQIKNHSLFLRAAQKLKIAEGDKKTRFLVVGDGELRAELEAQTQQLAIADRVFFTGWIGNLSPLYADLDVLALTSNNEGTPVAVIEAMAAGVPVLATDVGGVRELVSDRGMWNLELERGEFEVCERGVLVQPGDAEGFARGLRYMLEHPDVCREMGQRGREHALEHHSMERLVSDMDRLYRSLM